MLLKVILIYRKMGYKEPKKEDIGGKVITTKD
jgi:hypothetical protein